MHQNFCMVCKKLKFSLESTSACIKFTVYFDHICVGHLTAAMRGIERVGMEEDMGKEHERDRRWQKEGKRSQVT